MAAIHKGASAQEFMVYELVTENGRDVVRARKVALGGVYNNQVEVLPAGSEAMLRSWSSAFDSTSSSGAHIFTSTTLPLIDERLIVPA